jgi:hypothetical protein
MKSSLFKLSKNSIVKAGVMVVLTAIVMSLAPFFTEGSGKDLFDITKADLMSAIRDGLKVGVAYLVTTYFTNNKGQFLKKDEK